MARKVIILDTSILCVWLGVPGMDRIEKKGEDIISQTDVDAKIRAEIDEGARIVLPLASVIECGNHITQIKGTDPKRYIDEFADFILRPRLIKNGGRQGGFGRGIFASRRGSLAS